MLEPADLRAREDAAGVIYQSSSTSEFKIAVTDPEIKKGMYVHIEHATAGPVLGQVAEIEVRSKLTLDQAYRISRGEAVDVNEKRAATISVIGYRDEQGHILLPQTPFRIGQFVSCANEHQIRSVLGLEERSDRSAYLGLLRDHEIEVDVDINTLLQRHFSVIARTGSGKSYTVGVLVEELLKHDVPAVIVDPHGEYHTLMHPNIDVEPRVVRRFGIHPQGFAGQVVEYVLDTDESVDGGITLTFDDRNLDLDDLIEMTGLRTSGTLIGILSRALDELRTAPTYHLEDIIETVFFDKSAMKWNIIRALEHISSLGIFSRRPTPLSNLVQPGQVSLINLKGVPPHIQEVIVSRLGTQTFKARKHDRIPPMVFIVEESHKYAPQKGTVLSSKVLHTLASEGRKFGLGLGVVTQRPALVDKNVLSQCNTQIILKTTNPNDLKAISASVEGLTSHTVKEIQRLPVGVALLVGGNVLQPILVEIRTRETKHGGRAQALLE